jgi:stage V sporulation protein D (sporulation-specific penicillin-binding protein)
MAENKKRTSPQHRPKRRRRNPVMTPGVKILGYIVSIGAVLAATAIVVNSLYKIQIRDSDMYRQYASEQQLLDTTIQATRGEIYDATGKTLASTSVVWDIACDPQYSTALYTSETVETIDEQSGNIVKNTVRTLKPEVCAEISRGITLRLLSGDGQNLDAVDETSEDYQTQYEKIYNKLSQVDTQYRLLASKVNNAIKNSITEYISSYNKQLRANGEKNMRISITSTKAYQRDYPYGAFAASVIGFCDNDGNGFYGLEKYYNETLAGVNGRTITIRNAYGNAIADDEATTYEAKDGNNLVLSLDANVQEVLERYLTEAIAANNVENRACGIVMNVKTGAILAMASKPDYDPNEPYTIYDEEYLSELVHAEPELYAIYQKDENGVEYTDAYGNKIFDEEADYTGTYREIQWKNKAITELYYPGSVFKVITAAMGVDSGNATYYTSLACGGSYMVQDTTYHCAGRKAHGTQTLADGLRNSCNIYFIQLGQRIGSSLFYNYFKAFGFTETTGVDLPYETSFMQYYTDKTMGDVQLASSAFGQAMAITPLQICTAISACVNGGYLVTPHVVERITDSNGNVVQELGTTVRRQVISESASETIREIMEYEVGGGTITTGGYNAYVAGYRIGGKSGTSEQLNMDLRASDGDYKKVASFVAVLPADDPEILVYVMLDDPNNAKTDYSSILAAPVVGNIISEIAPYLGITTDGVDRSNTTVSVPNLVGTEWSNAQVSLNIKGLKHRLVESTSDNTGAVVTYQYPTAGTTVASGTTVYLYTEGYEGSYVTVPDVQGKSADFARQMLSAAGLNCVIKGDSSGVVLSQDHASGDSVQKGTIVTVVCGAAQ